MHVAGAQRWLEDGLDTPGCVEARGAAELLGLDTLGKHLAVDETVILLTLSLHHY